MSDDLCDEPITVMTSEGVIVLTGPGRIAVAMTPEAAAESGRRLLQAAEALRPGVTGQGSLRRFD